MLSSPTNLALPTASDHSFFTVLYPLFNTLIVPSGFKEYSAVVLFKSFSYLKSILAISYHFPRYLDLSNGVTAVIPSGIVEQENNPNIMAVNVIVSTNVFVFIIL